MSRFNKGYSVSNQSAQRKPPKATATAANDSGSERDLLLRKMQQKVFAITGEKVELFDPIVTAALIQHELIGSVSDSAIARIESAGQQAAEQIQRAGEEVARNIRYEGLRLANTGRMAGEGGKPSPSSLWVFGSVGFALGVTITTAIALLARHG
jgi:hypothetical protein